VAGLRLTPFLLDWGRWEALRQDAFGVGVVAGRYENVRGVDGARSMHLSARSTQPIPDGAGRSPLGLRSEMQGSLVGCWGRRLVDSCLAAVRNERLGIADGGYAYATRGVCVSS
jgi:hypothetical protein